MAIQVKNLVEDIYTKFGNIGRDQLAVELVYKYLYEELNKRLKEIEISEQNQVLKYADRSLTDEIEQLVSISDFGTPVAVHFVNPQTNGEVSIDIINFNALPAYSRDGKLACSIYGTPARIRFSTPLSDYAFAWTLRFWYETSNEVAKGANADVLVSPQFRTLVTNNVMLALMPFVQIPTETKEMIAANIMRELPKWDELWDADVNASKMYGNNRRLPFRAGRLDRRNRRW